MCIKAPSGEYKIADQWEETPHRVLSQLADQPVFQVQPVDAVDAEIVRVLHRNMLFPVQFVVDPMNNDDKNFALMKANFLIDFYFDN